MQNFQKEQKKIHLSNNLNNATATNYFTTFLQNVDAANFLLVFI